jgi:tetratricopeptide (TPR) repeat protein
MSKCGFRSSLFAVILGICSSSISLISAAQTSPKPLRASEVMALEVGGAMQANIAHDISERGLNFRPDEEFVALMKKAGADGKIVDALKAAKVDAAAVKPDAALLRQLCDASVLMRDKKYAEAGAKLSDALESSFARMETGFAMAELLRRTEQYEAASKVYAEIEQAEPDFPEIHDKASLIFYKLEDGEGTLREAKAALQEYPFDAEAHKNMGLAMTLLGKPDAAISEYKEALRIKPDYALVHFDLGVLYYNVQSYDDAAAEYKKAIGLNPKDVDSHYNLGNTYKKKGDIAAAIVEFREAKKLDPNDPRIRQNLASALMQHSPVAAIAELRELEQRFPSFEICHICLGRALAFQGDRQGAEAEFRKANELDPTDADGPRGLGKIEEQQGNLDAALEQYRKAEQIAPGDVEARADIGRVLLAKKDYMGAVSELKQAEGISESSWEIHELYGKALLGTGQTDLAIGELKEAIALNPSRAVAMTELGSALEEKGDWVGALEQYRKAVLADKGLEMKAQPGQAFEECGKECRDQSTAAQARFADYLVSLRAAGRGAEAADLEKRVAQLDNSASSKDKVEMAIKAGDEAFQKRNIEDAEKSYKKAVDLAQNLPPGDEDLIVALGRLGNTYGMRQDFTDAAATFHQQLALVEKTFGPGSTKSVEPLRFLGQLAAWQKNYAEAESYLQRALDINLKMAGDNDPRAVESLRALAGLYETESDWPKAETYLLRAVKGAEASNGMVLIPLWGLCDMYDRAGNPEKAQPCWHRATDLMAQQVGENSPQLAQSLTNEANALRKLGKNDDAQKVEERLTKIHRTAQ